MGFAAVWNSHPKDHSKGGRDWCVRFGGTRSWWGGQRRHALLPPAPALLPCLCLLCVA